MNSVRHIGFLSTVHTSHGFAVSESLAQSLPIAPQDRGDLLTDTIHGAEILQHSDATPSGPEVGTEAERQPPRIEFIQFDIAIFNEIYRRLLIVTSACCLLKAPFTLKIY